jgi:hypothetical protein
MYRRKKKHKSITFNVGKKYSYYFLIDSYIIFFLSCHISILNLKYSFKTRSGLAGRPGLKPGRVEEKIEEEKTWWVDPARSSQKPGCNPLTFVFFTKMTSF